MRMFRHNMQEFVIYRLNKTGNWQEPITALGPDRGGLSVKFYIKKGKWEGAPLIPYIGTKDLNVFRETHVIKSSKDGQWYIWAEILTPPIDSPEGVRSSLVELFSNFDKYNTERAQRSTGSPMNPAHQDLHVPCCLD